MPLRSVVPGQEGFVLQEVWGVGQLGWGGILEIPLSVKMQRREILHGMISNARGKKTQGALVYPQPGEINGGSSVGTAPCRCPLSPW